ncbi:MAG: hypothetical protein LBT70_04795 [Holosporaceae bacterium]|jgi:type VI secretion system protein ImpL|nr:hypothetical protein [Holosporaceae bacterium]
MTTDVENANSIESGLDTVASNVDAAVEGGMEAVSGALDVVQSNINVVRENLASIPKEVVPAITMGMIIVAIFLIIVFFSLCVFYINSKPTPATIRKEKKKDTAKDITKEKMRHEDLPIISGRLGEILTLHGILKAGPVTKMFFQIMNVIRNSTYEVRWRYKLPCFMVVGPENSGKTTMLNSLNFEYLTADGSSLDPLWKLFKKAAVFEFPRMETTEDKKKFWSFISELFLFIRPRRPLDGIIVTLPMDMLISEASSIEKHAQEMFDRIFAFQREVNFRLPIYVIITKSDLVPGFSELAHLLNERAQQQIFGWSNPYAIGSAFSTAWVDEIFDTINAGIRKAIFAFAKENKFHFNLEKAVLLGAQLHKLKNPLSQYLHMMFKAHNPMDGLLLRGVYCVGKQKKTTEAPTELLQPLALSPELLSNANGIIAGRSSQDQLYFVQDLLSEKIFKEFNLAAPIKVDTVEVSSVALRNKIIFASGALIISMGWFHGNHKIRIKIADYYHSLADIRSMIFKVKFLEKHINGPEDQYVINKQISNLLQNMPVVNRYDVFSIFVPQSWFSSIRENIMDSLGLVFDAVVVKAMYIDLNINARQILLPPEIEHQDESGDIFDINSFATLKALLDFAQKLHTIQRVSTEYNEIRQLEDRKSVIDLTRTLFNSKFHITEEVKTRLPNKKLMPPQFRLEPLRPQIENTLRMLFQVFLDDVFSDRLEKIFQMVAGDIDHMVAISKDAAVDFAPQDLAKMYQKTVLICDIMKNKNFQWISANSFAPTQKYVDMMNGFGASDVISRNYAKNLVRIAEVEFHKFKHKLKDYKTSITDHLLSENLNAPSEGFICLQKELKAMLELPFICAVPPSTFMVNIMDDKMLIWDLKKLKELSDLVDKYYEFTAAIPKDMRPQYFDMYKTIARKCFFPTLKSMVGSAEIMDDIPLGKSQRLLENAYERQSQNVKEATVLLTKIIRFLDEIYQIDNIQDFGFANMIVSHYTGLLEKIDALFNLETPYSSGEALFDGWDGESKPQYLNISDQDSLKKYLSSQFARIKFLAKDLAAPLIELLSMPHVHEKVKRTDLLDKWNEIITNVTDYELQKPGNSIASLEAFLSGTLKKVSLDALDQQGEIKEFSETGGDFFIERRSNVAKALMSRAETVLYEKAAAAYKEIFNNFNAALAKKFPFGGVEEEASLTDVENFIALYEKNSVNLQRVLEKNKEARQLNPEIFDFLASTDKLLAFLKSWVAHSKSPDPQNAGMVFNFILRPAAATEALTSSVLERIVEVNSNNIADGANATYFNGNNVNVTFNWVGSASDKPYKEAAKGNLSISGASAKFSYGGKWALFRMIEQQKMRKDVEYVGGVLLEFDIPVADSAKGHDLLTAKIIMKVTPMAKVGDKFTPIAWPVFPASCPSLHGEKNPPSAKPSANPPTPNDLPDINGLAKSL